MTDDASRPDRPPTVGFLYALDVPRNAAIGGVIGLILAVCAYLFRVLELFGPFSGTRQYPVLGPEGWFLILAFTLASATALFVATALTLLSAVRLARQE